MKIATLNKERTKKPLPPVSAERASTSMRATRIRFHRHMRVVKEISDDLYAHLKSLPTPDKEEREEMEEALSPTGGITPDMHFLGALHAVIFLISEAVLLAEEEKRFARSKAAFFTVHPSVMKGLENIARWCFRLRCPKPQSGTC